MALGKTMAEKAAWRAAEADGVELSTLCPGLITGPAFYDRNPTASLAYLKGIDQESSHLWLPWIGF